MKQCKLAPNITVLCTRNFACMNMRAERFYVHKNHCTQILNLSSPEYVQIKWKLESASVCGEGCSVNMKGSRLLEDWDLSRKL